ncbi:hypothetical protein VTL71DRAFT_12958, partial [Oculimacula yallundae]
MKVCTVSSCQVERGQQERAPFVSYTNENGKKRNVYEVLNFYTDQEYDMNFKTSTKLRVELKFDSGLTLDEEADALLALLQSNNLRVC